MALELPSEEATAQQAKSGLDPSSRARFNLRKASVLLFDPSPVGLDILVQIVTGLGAKTLHRATSAEEARTAVQRSEIDLIIADAGGPTGEGYEFARWLRREATEPNCFAPLLLTAGHTAFSEVTRARDCGAHFLLKRPLTPMAVIERIIWIGREGRSFISCDAYIGPERRFKNLGPPNGDGRRSTDLPIEVGEANEPNLSQDVIDGMLRPTKVML